MPKNRALRILACVSSDVEPRLRTAVQEGDMLFAANVEDALHALTHVDFDLVLIGMRFDESRGLDLMQRVSSNTSFAGVPVIGVRDTTKGRAASPRAFDLPMRMLGARQVVDLAVVPNVLRGLSPP